MKVALLWTISDFPAYGMLSGWSTHGIFACSYCMGDNKSFGLKKGRKPCWFDCHRRFLPIGHPFCCDWYSFKKSTMENSLPPQHLSRTDVLSQVNQLNEITLGLKSCKQKQLGHGTTHNWVKKIIFWELSYRSTNLIRHNLDVMHVEKNVFDNIFNIVMYIKDKTMQRQEKI